MIIANVYSNKARKSYEILRISQYDIETSLDIPADYFSITIENPINLDRTGMNSGIFNPNDYFEIKENGKTILTGIADDVDEYWDEDGSKIEITGRDKSMILLENDAEPKTYYKMKLSSYIHTIANKYGFKVRVNPKHDKVLNKSIVEVGDSEWDTILRETKRFGIWLWCEPDGTLVADELRYNSKVSYTFSNNIVNTIRIKRFSKKKRGADIKNEVWIRGHDKKSFTVKYKDSEFTNEGYNRRSIIEDGDVKNVSKGQEVAKNFIVERKRGNFEIELTINGKHHIETNRTAYVKDNITKTDGVYLIMGVRSTKSESSGSEKIIRLRPLWEGLA